MSVQPEVVVTGLGLVLPCGDGLEAARASLRSGTACFGELPPNLGQGRAAVCAAFNPAGIIPPMQLRRLDRPSRFAWVAAHQAFQDAGLDPKAFGGERIAVAVGTLTGGNEASEAFMRPYVERGPEGASPLIFPNCVANAASGHLALAFGLKGPSATHLEREVGTFSALDQALRWLRSGMADAVLLVGTDGLFPMLMEVLGRARMLDRHQDPALGSGRGMVPGEGAQAFLLERRADAEARGARIRARLAGVALRPAADGSEEARAEALADAVAALVPESPDRWIGGASGLHRIDALEQRLRRSQGAWPEPVHPKLLWGELCGVGGPLLAAALMEPAARVLVTGPASFGTQAAALLESVAV
ncbi:MAG TPA: beta-ketoacyl synthase N-terminal-like domain-containing protein [Holophagaceae bacterium]|nr:beta-ketoacyl synthase N-terminal-like domain-containing protein [Holophagaceae bacterium]